MVSRGRKSIFSWRSISFFLIVTVGWLFAPSVARWQRARRGAPKPSAHQYAARFGPAVHIPTAPLPLEATSAAAAAGPAAPEPRGRRRTAVRVAAAGAVGAALIAAVAFNLPAAGSPAGDDDSPTAAQDEGVVTKPTYTSFTEGKGGVRGRLTATATPASAPPPEDPAAPPPAADAGVAAPPATPTPQIGIPPGESIVPIGANLPIPWVGVNNWGLASASDVNGICGANSENLLEAKMTDLKAAGVDVIRFAAYQSFAINGNHQRDWTAYDRVFASAQAHGMQLIPILGNNWTDCDYWGARPTTYSCSSPPSRSCGEPVACGGSGNWYDVGYKQPYDGYITSFQQWTTDIVTRYRGHPTIAAWEVLNEPWETCAHEFFVDIVGRIRAADATARVSLGGDANGWNYQTENSIPGVSWMTSHDYGRDDEPLPGGIADDLALSLALGKPYYIGESGIDACDTQLRADQLKAKMYATFANGGVGYIAWAYSQTAPLGTCGLNFGPDSPIMAIFDDF